MSVYKVLQDIEAEDQFLGPLTLRQFIYAAIAGLCGYLSFIGFLKKLWLLPVFLLPVMIFGAFLAWPWSKDQSNEVWLLAKIRFFLKPRRRIWNQSGMKDLVTITAPKKIERQLTDGLSQSEVKSRLQALANTIDSRGWAVKNVNINLFGQPSYVTAQDNSDRLVNPAAMPQNVPTYDITAQDDVLDEQSNPTAQHFNEMITASDQAHKQQAVAKMQNTAGASTQANYWFMNEPAKTTLPAGAKTFSSPPVVNPRSTYHTSRSAGPTNDEELALLEKIHHDQDQPDPTNYHMRNVEPVSPNMKHASNKKHSHSQPAGAKDAAFTSTDPSNPAILELANNDDLNVATIARQADKARKKSSEDEVVISLR